MFGAITFAVSVHFFLNSFIVARIEARIKRDLTFQVTNLLDEFAVRFSRCALKLSMICVRRFTCRDYLLERSSVARPLAEQALDTRF